METATPPHSSIESTPTHLIKVGSRVQINSGKSSGRRGITLAVEVKGKPQLTNNGWFTISLEATKETEEETVKARKGTFQLLDGALDVVPHHPKGKPIKEEKLKEKLEEKPGGKKKKTKEEEKKKKTKEEKKAPNDKAVEKLDLKPPAHPKGDRQFSQ